jgi:hypothetical protein
MLLQNWWRQHKNNKNMPLKGIKFHVFEHISDESMRHLRLSADKNDDEDDTADNNDLNKNEKSNHNNNNNGLDAATIQKESTPHLRVWVFAAIFDPVPIVTIAKWRVRSAYKPCLRRPSNNGWKKSRIWAR